MFGIAYVSVRLILYRGSACLRKLYSPWNRIQYKYNQVRYKGENQNRIYWHILGSYNNGHIINCIDSKKQHEATSTDMSVHIRHNTIRNIALNIGK